jgi:hypothetical protein
VILPDKKPLKMQLNPMAKQIAANGHYYYQLKALEILNKLLFIFVFLPL